MNLKQITELLAQTRIQPLNQNLTVGGGLRRAGSVQTQRFIPPNLQPIGIKRQRPESFIPGYNHKDWGRKKKRKKTSYEDERQRLAHKAFEKNHRDEIRDVSTVLGKRRRDSEAELKLQKERVESFLAEEDSGLRRRRTKERKIQFTPVKAPDPSSIDVPDVKPKSALEEHLEVHAPDEEKTQVPGTPERMDAPQMRTAPIKPEAELLPLTGRDVEPTQLDFAPKSALQEHLDVHHMDEEKTQPMAAVPGTPERMDAPQMRTAPIKPEAELLPLTGRDVEPTQLDFAPKSALEEHLDVHRMDEEKTQPMAAVPGTPERMAAPQMQPPPSKPEADVLPPIGRDVEPTRLDFAPKSALQEHLDVRRMDEEKTQPMQPSLPTVSHVDAPASPKYQDKRRDFKLGIDQPGERRLRESRWVSRRKPQRLEQQEKRRMPATQPMEAEQPSTEPVAMQAEVPSRQPDEGLNIPAKRFKSRAEMGDEKEGSDVLDHDPSTETVLGQYKRPFKDVATPLESRKETREGVIQQARETERHRRTEELKAKRQGAKITQQIRDAKRQHLGKKVGIVSATRDINKDLARQANFIHQQQQQANAQRLGREAERQRRGEELKAKRQGAEITQQIRDAKRQHLQKKVGIVSAVRDINRELQDAGRKARTAAHKLPQTPSRHKVSATRTMPKAPQKQGAWRSKTIGRKKAFAATRRKLGYPSGPMSGVLPKSPPKKSKMEIEKPSSLALYPNRPPPQQKLHPIDPPKIKLPKLKLRDPPRKMDISPKPSVGKKARRRRLEASRSSSSMPVVKKKKSSPPKESSPSPKKRKSRGRRDDSPRGSRGSGTGRGASGVQQSDFKSAPTQQVSVSAPSSAGLSALLAKVDKLLKNQEDAKRKTEKNKAFTAAKKAYRTYRKDMLQAVKKQNKEIKRKQLAKIRRMPANQRAAARKSLKEQLKKREESVMKRYPAKISTSDQLKQVVNK